MKIKTILLDDYESEVQEGDLIDIVYRANYYDNEKEWECESIKGLFCYCTKEYVTIYDGDFKRHICVDDIEFLGLIDSDDILDDEIYF